MPAAVPQVQPLRAGRKDVMGRPAEDREPVPDQLGSGDSGQDPLHQRPVGPGRMQDLPVDQQGAVDEDAPQVKVCAALFV